MIRDLILNRICATSDELTAFGRVTPCRLVFERNTAVLIDRMLMREGSFMLYLRMEVLASLYKKPASPEDAIVKDIIFRRMHSCPLNRA